MMAFLDKPHRLTQALLALLALGVWASLIGGHFPNLIGDARAEASGTSATFETLTVQRINVVDPVSGDSIYFWGGIWGQYIFLGQSRLKLPRP